MYIIICDSVCVYTQEKVYSAIGYIISITVRIFNTISHFPTIIYTLKLPFLPRYSYLPLLAQL